MAPIVERPHGSIHLGPRKRQPERLGVALVLQDTADQRMAEHTLVVTLELREPSMVE
jgi:hypothetical protein